RHPDPDERDRGDGEQDVLQVAGGEERVGDDRQHHPQRADDRDERELLALDRPHPRPAARGRGDRLRGRGHATASPSSPAAAARTSAWLAPRANSRTTCPFRTTSTRSASCSTSGRSVEMTRTALPPSASSRTSRWISSFAPTSTPCVGSSSTSTRGARTSWRASTTFCWLPPESAPTAVPTSGALMAIRRRKSSAMDRSRRRSNQKPSFARWRRWALEMLNAIDLFA